MANANPRARNWCFTINNPESYELEPEDWVPAVKRVVYQSERGEEGTLHIQGYVEFTNRVYRNAVARIEQLSTAHLEVARGNFRQNLTYCTKDEGREDGPHYWPDMGAWAAAGQGRRSDIEGAIECLKRTREMTTVADEHGAVFVKYGRGLKDLQRTLNLAPARRSDRITTIWMCGPPGTGKTYWAEQNYPEGEECFYKNEGKWWDGYAGQETVVFNDFDSSWFTLGTLKRILDTAPMNVETKGGMIPLLATTFIFTANKHPKKLYAKALAKQGWTPGNPLYRRFPDIRLKLEIYVPEEEVERVDEAMDWDDGYGDDEIMPGQYGYPENLNN